MKTNFRPHLGLTVAIASAMPMLAHSDYRNLRVGIFDWEDGTLGTIAPRQRMGGHSRELTYEEIRAQVSLGFNLWQSILPDMNWRLEDNPQGGNYKVLFKDLDALGQGGSTSGTEMNVNGKNLAGNDITFINNSLQHDYFSWLFNPNAPHWAKMSNPSACQTLPPTVAADTVKWSEGCVNYSNYPRWNELYGHDLAGTVQHEYGHVLMNPTDFTPFPTDQFDHTQPNGVTVNDRYMYWPASLAPQQRHAWTRRPIYEPNYLIRRKDDGVSMMFMGNGIDNHALRGVFPIDAHQLANEGYRVTFPNISGAIVMKQGPTGKYTLTSNWDEARNLMVWPNQGTPLTPSQADTMHYLVDVFPRSQTHRTLAAGENHTLAIRENGSLWAWGANSQGQLGDGTTTPRLSPKQVSSGPWVSVAAGLDFSLGIKADGSLWAWGDNSQGQLGDPALSLSADKSSPWRVGTANDWLTVSAGALHVVAIKKSGKAFGWGYNSEAELGLGNTTSPIRSVSPICPSGSSCQGAVFIAVSAGSNHTLALDKDGAAWGWGSNASSQLTVNLGSLVTVPALFSAKPDIHRWSQVEAGHEHSSGISNGNLYTWGKNQFGQLGQGFTGGTVGWPYSEGYFRNTWASLFSGHWHAGGTLFNGTWSSWGYNFAGQLGTSNTQSSSYGVPEYTGVANWVQGVGRQQHTLGLRRDGTLWGWGTNASGELGTGGTSASVTIPVQSKYVDASLSGARTTYSSTTITTIDLTSTGPVQWQKWGTNDHAKRTIDLEKQYKLTTPIGPYERINAASVSAFDGNALRFKWNASDEVNGADWTANAATGISIGGTSTGRGFRLTIPARQVQRTLKLYVGAYRVRGKLKARFSDNTTAEYVNTDLNSGGTATAHTNGMYAITFYSMHPQSNLIVEWTVDAQNTTSGNRFVTLRAATIE